MELAPFPSENRERPISLSGAPGILLGLITVLTCAWLSLGETTRTDARLSNLVPPSGTVLELDLVSSPDCNCLYSAQPYALHDISGKD